MSLTLPDVIEAVKSRKVTQAAIAREAGLTQATLSYIVTGVTKSASHKNVMAILDAAKRLGIKKASRQNTDEKQRKNRKSSVERGAA